jgi:hypothetical protein
VFAEFETNLRRERQLEGIAKAKAAGVYKGRPPTIDPSEVLRLKHEGLGVEDRQAAPDRPRLRVPCACGRQRSHPSGVNEWSYGQTFSSRTTVSIECPCAEQLKVLTTQLIGACGKLWHTRKKLKSHLSFVILTSVIAPEVKYVEA